jgi:tRNA-dihydrouridine synthase A
MMDATAAAGHDGAASSIRLALQLGGSEPGLLAQAARIGADWGYDEINLNVGCPSDRVQAGRFGACLMREPALVADCFAAMQAAVAVPVTVKCRSASTTRTTTDSLFGFVDAVAAAGCRTFVVHARKAWLQGLSPKENREVPPLRYDWCIGSSASGPDAADRDQRRHRQTRPRCRSIWPRRRRDDRPRRLSRPLPAAPPGSRAVRARAPPRARDELLRALRPYVEAQARAGVMLKHISRHVLGLFARPARRARSSARSSATGRTGPGRTGS